MSPLAAARTQMAVSLGFHMIFAAVGMALPLMMLVAERRWIRYQDRDALALARVWSRLTAVLFAIGAVSGTALSFELGLLWPRFMAFAGPFIGTAFALEGYAFFVEAIFLGLYLYGWDRLTPRAHWLCGWAVAVSGALSGILVLSTNAWMQEPVGFRVAPDGSLVDLDVWRALFNPAWPLMAAHSTLSTYEAVGFAAAGVYAWALLRGRRPQQAARHRAGLRIALLIGGAAAIAQPFLGDLLGRRAYERQPAKLAAMEGQFLTERGAPLRLGGWPDEESRETRYGVEIPGLLSLMLEGRLDAEVAGLDRFPREDWPNVPVTHLAFQAMVGAGTILFIVATWHALWRWRRRGEGADAVPPRLLLKALVVSAPLGFLALEAGWVVTEVGRQPWVVYGHLRTADAVTPVGSVWGSLLIFSLVYALLLAILAAFLWRFSREGNAAT